MALSGGKGNSRAQTSSSSTTNTETNNFVDNSIHTSDFGAISAGAQVASDAVAANRDLAESVLQFSGDSARVSSDLAESATRGALDFGGDTIDAALNFGKAAFQSAGESRDAALAFGKDALTRVQAINANSLDLFGELVDKTIDSSKTLARDSAQANANSLEAAVNGFKTLAVQNSETSDDKITRVIGYALAAVAAVVVLPMVFKGGGKTVLA